MAERVEELIVKTETRLDEWTKKVGKLDAKPNILMWLWSKIKEQ